VYGWIYRRLPGPPPLRVASAVLLVLAAVALLLFVVFPAVEAHLPSNRVTVDG
jgi:hypothetical protein